MQEMRRISGQLARVQIISNRYPVKIAKASFLVFFKTEKYGKKQLTTFSPYIPDSAKKKEM